MPPFLSEILTIFCAVLVKEHSYTPSLLTDILMYFFCGFFSGATSGFEPVTFSVLRVV